MKKFLILIALLVVLLGLWWFLGRQEEARQVTDVPTGVTQIDSLTMNRIVLSHYNQPPIVFEKDAGGFWVLAAPMADRANANLAKQLEQSLAKMKFVNKISERAGQHAAFQIDEASGMRVQVYADSQLQADVYLGKLTPDRTHVYARLTGSDEVFSATGGGPLAAMRTRDLDSFRDRNIMDRDQASFDSVDVRAGATSYRLVRVDSATWNVRIGPAADRRANASVVDGLLRALGRMTASGFRPDSVAVDWSRPDVTITAWLLGEPEVRLDMMAAPEARYWVRSSTRAHDLAVFESVYKTFQRDPKEFLETPAQGS
jgi:hypothetical protein